MSTLFDQPRMERKESSQRRNVLLKIASTTTLATAVMAGASFAQEASETDEVGFETVTVTAQRRAEDLQDVPVSVTMLSSDEIALRNITSVDTLNFSVPNLSFVSDGNRAHPPIFAIRGLGTSFSSSLPRSTIIIDDAPRPNLAGMDLFLFDLEQIQVLRGPQSTLFGVTSEGGAVLITTRAPSDTFEARGEVNYGSLGEFSTTASISGPIIDSVAFGLAANYRHSDGYLDNLTTGDELDSGESWSIAPRLLITPTSNSSIDIRWAHQEINEDYGQKGVPYLRDLFTSDGYPVLDFHETAQNTPGYTDSDSDDVSIVAKLDLSRFELASVTSYSRSDLDVIADLDGTPNDGSFPGVGTIAGGRTEVGVEFYSQELRLTSPSESSFRWLGGLFFSHREEDTVLSFVFPDTSQMPFQSGYQEIETSAIFGQIDWDMTDRLTFGAGVRYEEADGTLVSGGSTYTDSTDVVLPRLTLTYELTEDVSIYTNIAKGWLPGLMEAVAGSTPINIDDETLWSYEVGAKTEFFDNRVRLNFAAYVSEVSDYQESYRTPSGFVALGNAGDVEMHGLEFEFEALPTANLMFAVNAGYTSSEFADGAVVTGNPVGGNRVPGIPEWNFDATVTYDFLTDYFARVNFSANAEAPIYDDATNTFYDQGVRTGGARLWNVALGYRGDRFNASLYVDNLTDEEYYEGGFGLFSAGTLSDLYMNPGAPRQIGIRLGASF